MEDKDLLKAKPVHQNKVGGYRKMWKMNHPVLSSIHFNGCTGGVSKSELGARFFFCISNNCRSRFSWLSPLQLKSMAVQRIRTNGRSSERMNTDKDQNSVQFPRDYDELLEQVNAATLQALEDSKQLLEIEFPTAGLDSVAGDAEGVIEMNSNMTLMREFCRTFMKSEKAAHTRVFFPEAKELELARKTAFEGALFEMDYLTRPSLLDDFGFSKKEMITDRVQSSDKTFLIAYPYFNVNEMLVVEELYNNAVANRDRRLIIFNGELDRIRSGYYPSFFYPKLAALAKNFLPKLETVYYIHNFKGRLRGSLFRSYPGPWQVLIKVDGSYALVHQQKTMPSLKEVALKILPSAYV